MTTQLSIYCITKQPGARAVGEARKINRREWWLALASCSYYQFLTQATSFVDVGVDETTMQQGDQMMEGSGKEQQMQMVCVRSASTAGAAGEEHLPGEWSAADRSALSLFKEKEEEIERKKVEVRDKVFSMLGRVEEESKRLAFIRQELEVMADPTRREVDAIRKRIDKVNKQLKPLGKTCLRKEKEYKMCLDAYNEKSNEKATLVNRLMELVSESERLRMKKLEELNKTIESLY